MELKLNKLPAHNYKCIVVPSEKLKKQISDYKTIIVGKDKYKVIQWVTIHKSEPIPSSLMLLSIGVVIDNGSVFEKYKNSDKLIFFICEFIN